MKNNKCFFITKGQKYFFENQDIPLPKPNEAIIQTKAAGICGTDIHFYKDGELGNFQIENPYIPGHETSGVVYAVGADVTNVKPGQRVVVEPGVPCRVCSLCAEGRYNICSDLQFMGGATYDGTFRNYFPIRSELVYPIPDVMSFEEGALVEPTAVSLHILRRIGDIVGKSLILMGAGPIGMLVVMAYKALGGGHVTCVDINQSRLERVLSLGADEIINTMKDPLPEDFAQVVIETAGSPITTGQLFDVAARGARIVQAGWVKGNIAEMNIAQFISKELDYVASLDYANEFPAAIRLMADHRIDSPAIVTHRFRFDEAGNALDFTVENPNEVIKAIISF